MDLGTRDSTAKTIHTQLTTNSMATSTSWIQLNCWNLSKTCVSQFQLGFGMIPIKWIGTTYLPSLSKQWYSVFPVYAAKKEGINTFCAYLPISSCITIRSKFAGWAIAASKDLISNHTTKRFASKLFKCGRQFIGLLLPNKVLNAIRNAETTVINNGFNWPKNYYPFQ